MSQIQKIELDEVELRAAVERLLGERFRRGVEVASLKREASPFSTLFPADVLSLELRNGGTMSLFLKHLGSEQSDHPEKQCREREIRIYQNLFSENGLPVPKYYGSPGTGVQGDTSCFSNMSMTGISNTRTWSIGLRRPAPWPSCTVIS